MENNILEHLDLKNSQLQEILSMDEIRKRSKKESGYEQI